MRILCRKARDGAFDRIVDLTQAILEKVRRVGSGKAGNSGQRNIDAVEEARFRCPVQECANRSGDNLKLVQPAAGISAPPFCDF